MYKYDVCIVGGGTSGAMAAIQSAKLGLSVVVVEKMGSLGGTSTNGLVTPSMPTYVGSTKLLDELENELLKHHDGIYSNIYVDELNSATIERPDESSTTMYFSKEGMEFSLEDLCVKYGVNILYDTVFVKSNVEDSKIVSILVQTSSGNKVISAANYIDASGDALLSIDAGIKYNSGNEEGKNQFTSLRFELINVNMDKFLHYMNVVKKQKYSKSEYPFYTFGVLHQGKEQVLEDLLTLALKDEVITIDEYRWIQGFSIPSKGNTFSFNCPRIPNQDNVIGCKNKSKNYIVGRKMIRNITKFFQIYVPGFEDCSIGNIAPTLGVRESNRIVGKYILTANDYNLRRKFDDGVVKCDWWIDIHKNDHDSSDENRYHYREYFEIPYRSLITNEIKNLIVIGRCISADFAAQASIRIQPQCRMMGEVAGYACKISKNNNVELNEINGEIIKSTLGSNNE